MALHPRIARSAAWLVAGLSVGRVLLHGFLDRRPRFGGAEASDLCSVMFAHQALRGHGDGLEGILRTAEYKPPLWSVGVAALHAPLESLSYPLVLATNGAALAVALWACWNLARQTAGPTAGLLAVVLASALPLSAGRVTVLGVEPWHMALLALSLKALLDLRRKDATRAQSVTLSLAVGMGMLMKWTFAAPLLGPLVLEMTAAAQGGPNTRAWRRRLLLSLGGAGILFAAWFLPLARLDRILTSATSDPSHGTGLSLQSLAVLGRWSLQGLGASGLGLLLLSLLGRPWANEAPAHEAQPGRPLGQLLLSSVVTLVAVHWLVPHKELRYLLPAAAPVAVLAAIGLGRSWHSTAWARAAIALGVTALVTTSFVLPQWRVSGSTSSIPPENALHLSIDPSDYGLEALVTIQDREEPAEVLASLEGNRAPELLTMINWEFYGRNRTPVLSLPSFVPITDAEARHDLARATHLVTNRALDAGEIELLESRGFRPVRSQTLGLPGPTTWSLWARASRANN